MSAFFNYGGQFAGEVNYVNYDCTPGDRITIKEGRENMRVSSTYPNGVFVIDEERLDTYAKDETLQRVFTEQEYCGFGLTYEFLREQKAFYTALRLKPSLCKL